MDYDEATLELEQAIYEFEEAHPEYNLKNYGYINRRSEGNGYEVAGLSRESNIDGVWNKESVDEWLADIQLPVK